MAKEETKPHKMRLKKIRAGLYHYRGYKIQKVPGHREPNGKPVWEIFLIGNSFDVFQHLYTLKDSMKWIDWWLEREK